MGSSLNGNRVELSYLFGSEANRRKIISKGSYVYYCELCCVLLMKRPVKLFKTSKFNPTPHLLHCDLLVGDVPVASVMFTNRSEAFCLFNIVIL